MKGMEEKAKGKNQDRGKGFTGIKGIKGMA
jgi:hypothetical protein